MSTDIRATLAERGKRYGKFSEQARISQALKKILMAEPNWQELKDDQKEGLEVVCHKIARIMNGDPHYHDNYHDISGYMTLVEDRILADKDREESKADAASDQKDNTPPPYRAAAQSGYVAALALQSKLPEIGDVFQSKYAGLFVRVRNVKREYTQASPPYTQVVMQECNADGTWTHERQPMEVLDNLATAHDVRDFYQRWIKV